MSEHVLMSSVTAFAPGRVNLIGEHTDYNRGLALPFAIAQGVEVRAVAAESGRVEAVARDLGERDEFALGTIRPAAGWRGFVRGVSAELGRRGCRFPGARIEISGTLPQGAGLGSSAAVAVSLALALRAIAGVPAPSEHERIELARLCSEVENVWVGARTGLLDQLAALLGERERAVAIDFRSLAIRRVPLSLEGNRLVLLDSGEQRANASSGYNRRREECERACALLGVGSLREARVEELERLPAPLADRARHVVEENARVCETIEALERGDWHAVGRLLDASHESSRDLYELSTPAVEAAAARLRRAGALGARLVGGGFGGHVLGLMPPGAQAPPGARAVEAGAGARVVVDG